MKHKTNSGFVRTCLGISLFLGLPCNLFAVNLYWDASPGNNGLTAGPGQWDAGSKQWSTSSTGGSTSKQQWAQGSAAFFNQAVIGATSVVTVSSPVNVASMTFNGTGYTIDGTSALTLNGPSITTGTNISAIISAPLAGSSGLTKEGTGTLFLNGANTYTGTTAVSEGTLIVGGSTLATSPFTVASVGTLGGTGTIGGSVTSSGTISPGGAPGATGNLTVTGTTTFSSGSIFSWDINSGNGSYDRLLGAIGGSDAKFNIVTGDSFAGSFWDGDHTWSNIFNGTPDLGSIFSSFTGSGLVNTGSGATTTGTFAGQGYFTFNQNSLNWTAVPETSSAAAGLLIGAGMLRRRRNNR